MKKYFAILRMRMRVSSLKRQVRKTERALHNPKNESNHYFLTSHLRFLQVKLESAIKELDKMRGIKKDTAPVPVVPVSESIPIKTSDQIAKDDAAKKRAAEPEGGKPEKKLSEKERKAQARYEKQQESIAERRRREAEEDIRYAHIPKKDVVCLIRNRHNKYCPQVRPARYAKKHELRVVYMGNIHECLRVQKKHPKQIHRFDIESFESIAV